MIEKYGEVAIFAGEKVLIPTLIRKSIIFIYID